MDDLILSVVIPACNEERNVGRTVTELAAVLRSNAVPYEIVVVDDNSTDGTPAVLAALSQADPRVKVVRRTPPGGFGRAIRAGLAQASGDAVVICMADCSDDPNDVVAYYRKLQEGYDCVFGSRFVRGGGVEHYPFVKLLLNRLTNKVIQALFWTRHNDMTNAFKGYRMHVIRACGPYHACHFNVTIEMSISALIRRYSIATAPIRWYGRTWGDSKLRIRDMGRRYLSTLLKLFFEKMLISDDLLADRMASQREFEMKDRGDRLASVEKRLATLEDRARGTR